MEEDFYGVIILESLNDPQLLQEMTILRESAILAPPDDPYPIWSRRLVRIPADHIEVIATRLAMTMKEDFYNHFVDSHSLIVVFKGAFFAMDKYDRTTWTDMVEYGKTVRVGPEWTENIPIDPDDLLS